ncbi:nitroreductase family protein [Clostridium algidicarnis]|uniref:nitroreductase family protein n=1 Tax=Clostridium algidicarnis TaxID=37659 RepID=UPI0004982928|nr:nitroreductase family protein [Clostridium algidicarnis]MBB6630727.1 nitroreductase family protein [Clostridium algidicarnis]MBU3202789.1 nitroreductase family protein [Clostridium algidicarnis]MBU3210943.1 nitroreductase family protein [Clostridium algidicarnis]MBU3222549.1 nitroreductase family protein [Clostridium algidicarnis]MBU3228741.1 nitroreductase family protein [Clostridium algidicarnis]
MENEVLKAIKNRRSTRKYKEKQISEEELQALLDAGIQAPSANNSQSWHFTVIQDRDMINFISDKSKEVMRESDNKSIVNVGKSAGNIFYNAPTLIIISGKKEVQSSLVDCSAAIENMLIAGESIGLGTVWVGFVRFFFTLAEQVKKLKLPDGYEPFYAVAVGYKEDDSVFGPSKRNKEVVNYIR